MLREFYGSIRFEPVWGPDPGGAARTALALDALLGARDHGLVPAHYGLAALRRRAEPATPAAAVQRELLLTDALLRYAVDLRAGRLRPAEAQPDWGIPAPDREDPVRELVEAIEAGTLASWLEALPPAHEGYARLVDRPPRRFTRRPIAPARAPARPILASARSRSTWSAGGGFRGASSPATSPSTRRTQPWPSSRTGGCGSRRAWSSATSSTPPRWCAPSSARSCSTLRGRSPPASSSTSSCPKLRANPRFLADNDIVILDRRDDPYGLAVNWAAVRAERFPFRLQQRPGGWNPLGRMRFATPNRFDVYLHDTPLPELFQRADRALSHGCVRVEQARELAALVLVGQAAGRPQALERAMSAGATSVVIVERPLPVYLLYWTAFVDDEGRLQLRDDPYDRDPRVAAALARSPMTASRPGGPVPVRPTATGPGAGASLRR